MSSIAVCKTCGKNFRKKNNRTVRSHCDECKPLYAKTLNRRNVYNRSKSSIEKETKEEYRIRLLEEEVKELKSIFETISDSTKRQIAKEVGVAIGETMKIATKNLEEDFNEHRLLVESVVADEFKKQNTKFQNQLAILNTRMKKLDESFTVLDSKMAEHLHYYTTKLSLHKNRKGGSIQKNRTITGKKRDEVEKRDGI
jgi:tRNA G26 N,N-dimethylase Trm1